MPVIEKNKITKYFLCNFNQQLTFKNYIVRTETDIKHPLTLLLLTYLSQELSANLISL